jgi:hypothetical protein
VCSVQYTTLSVMRINVLREALDNDQGSLGCRVASSWPAMVSGVRMGAEAASAQC